jgi:DNA-binding response OmpR family regulator
MNNTADKGGPVLVADDDPEILRLVRMTLEMDGYSVVAADSGRTAVREFMRSEPVLVVLDMNMPDIDGLETMSQLRKHNELVPVIILTGRSDAVDVTRALDSGADDYITKPFHPAILSSRIGALLRRASAGREPVEVEPLVWERVLLDVANRKVEVDGEEVHFSPTEWDLLLSLAASPGKVMLRDELITAVWGAEFLDEHHRLRLSISRLRSKLEENPDDPKIITTIRGIGYRLEPPE